MLIDKSKFLFLVTALSAASTACVLNTKTDGAGDGDGVGGSTTEGTTTHASSTATGTGTTATSSSASGTGGGPACLDDSSDVAACSSACEGISNCNVIANVKGEIGEDLAPCLEALDPDTCGLVDADNCLNASLSKACFDTAETQPICAQMAIDCAITDDTDWEDQCQVRLDGLNTTGRSIFTTCMTDGCMEGGAADLEFCSFQLFQ